MSTQDIQPRVGLDKGVKGGEITYAPTKGSTSGVTLGPSDAAASAASTVPASTDASKGKSLTGVPIGTQVFKGIESRKGLRGQPIKKKTYGTAQYKLGSGQTVFASLNNAERINLLLDLASIPNLYPKDKAPTMQGILAMESSGIIPIREEDSSALEKVMALADTTGDDYKTTITYLKTNPQLAVAAFGTPKGKKISLTPLDALAMEYEQSILDYLDVKPTKAEKNAYAKAVNEAERKRGGALSQLERQQLLVDSIQDKARQVFKGDAAADSDLLRRGALGETYTTLKNTYQDYGVLVDDKLVYKQAIQSLRSKQALDNILGKIKLQSEVAMPAIKSYIQQGLSPREALGSYIGLYSKIFNVPENQVDLTKLAPVYSGDKIMPYNDWQKYIYSMPEFKNTKVYQDQQFDDAQVLLRNFIG